MVNRNFWRAALVLALVLCGHVFAQTNKKNFSQKLEWKSEAKAFEYKVEVKNSAGAIKEFTTKDNFLNISMPSGNYEFRVTAYDFLGREASKTTWRKFTIRKAVAPKVKSTENRIVVGDKKSFSVPMQTQNVEKDSTVELIDAETGKTIAKGSVDENGGINFETVPDGLYKVRVTNPGGFSSETTSIKITEKTDEEIRAEEQRIAEERQQRLEDEKRIAQELRAAKEKREQEEQRLAEERRASEERQAALKSLEEEKKLSEQRRQESERLAQQKSIEEERLEKERQLAEVRRAEEKRIEEERIAEEKRLAEERRIAEEKRLAEERRIAEEKRIEEEKRVAEERRIAEEKRLEEEKRVAEEMRVQEARRQEEEKQLEKDRRLAEELRTKTEKLEEEKRLSEERRQESERIAEENRIAGERLAEEQRLAEERRAEEKRIAKERRKERFAGCQYIFAGLYYPLTVNNKEVLLSKYTNFGAALKYEFLPFDIKSVKIGFNLQADLLPVVNKKDFVDELIFFMPFSANISVYYAVTNNILVGGNVGGGALFSLHKQKFNKMEDGYSRESNISSYISYMYDVGVDAKFLFGKMFALDLNVQFENWRLSGYNVMNVSASVLLGIRL